MLKYLLSTFAICIILSSCGSENSDNDLANETIDSVAVKEEIAKYDSLSQKTEEVIEKIEESSNELDEALENLDN